MDSMIKGLFGNDDDDDNKAQDFISRYETGVPHEGYTDDEAMQNYQRVAQRADPEVMGRASEQAFSRMDPAQRQQMAQMLQQQGGGQFQSGVSDDPRQMAGMVSQLQRSNPSGLASMFGGGGGGGGGIGDAIGGLLGGGGSGGSGGGGGFPGGAMGKMALGGIAAYAMKEMMGGGGGGGGNKRRRSI